MQPAHHAYNGSLVILSVVVAMLASYTALDLSGRIHASIGRSRLMWLTGGAAAMGFGIWSMHFVGMLALHLGLPTAYATPHLVGSILVAIGAAGFALWIVGHPGVGYLRLAIAAVAMGIAIAGMHYLGMAGLRVDARIEYNGVLFAISIFIAIAASFVALYIARRLRGEESRRVNGLRMGAAVAMGFAIAGMHYTGMAAAHFVPMPGVIARPSSTFPPVAVGFAIAMASTLVAGLAMIAAMLDRLVRSHTVEARLRAEKDAAVAANRVKSEFLANMSHELRTPLNSIIGFSNILLKNRSHALGEREIEYVSRISVNGTHLLGLINGVLDVSKIEAGHMDLSITTVDLAELVRATLLELQPQGDARDVTLVAECPLVLSPLETDRVRLKQILINLVGNAIKFTLGGRVTVRVLAHANGAARRIDVVDSGIGIPANRLSAIFDAFQQADSSTSREYGGTGLGLTITRALVQLLGWDIEVSSTVGVGSTFGIVMNPQVARATPRYEAAAPTMKAEQVANVIPEHRTVLAPSLSRLRVLVIDDEEDARIILQHQLEELGCEVAAVATFDEGMRLARMVRPDLITLDIMMPRKNGIVGMFELQADTELCHIPIVMVSTVAGEQQRHFVGAVDWINKPVTRDALLAVIERSVFEARAAQLSRGTPT